MSIDTVPYPVSLTDGVVTLRAHRTSDADALAEAVRESVDTVGRWQDWCHAGYTTADAMSWLDICRRDWLLGDGFEMLIVDAHTDRLLGGMGVNQRNREQRIANLGTGCVRRNRVAVSRRARRGWRYGSRSTRCTWSGWKSSLPRGTSRAGARRFVSEVFSKECYVNV